ncbi:hypothetical protein Glove_97g113 [Diversispora epigaea]|uniref:Protein kinase domain-containing protein n=1 Tax=Diversispora epigaea TaxID=1348612 RepID=A0A397J5E7_9GLOM|nr:hypothetical protein Glove_97g113 [Diversispora epigaea]
MPFVCQECNQEYNQYHQWCKPCNSTRLKNDFDKWTSGNATVDKFIQDAQVNADIWTVIEWIPYEGFQDIKQLAKGGYGTIYYAMWVEGYIDNWDIKNQRWKRFGRYQVALKKLDGIIDINKDFLHEMSILLRTNNTNILSTSLHGITKDPVTHEFMMVLQYFKGGNLRDFGLSKLITKNPNPQKNTISGVLPYIAPEVLIGGEYTKAADVYSFAFIAYEIITLLPPYHDASHDKDLAVRICNGFRPKIPFHIPKLITRIIMRCWDARMTRRPTFDELDKELDKYLGDYYEKNYKNSNEITIQIKEAEEFSKNQTTAVTTTTTTANYKTHPQAIFTSRLLDFSNLPGPKNEVNFEKELEELSESFYQINASDGDDDLDMSNL